MRNWQGKFITFLIVFFAGFATAVYALAPSSKTSSKSNAPAKTASISDNTTSQELAYALNSGMHKFQSFAEEKSRQAGRVIKQKLEDYKEHNRED